MKGGKSTNCQWKKKEFEGGRYRYELGGGMGKPGIKKKKKGANS